MNYELVYEWGFFRDSKDVATRWFIRARTVDDEWYAVAYYSMDDEEPWRLYETNNNDLLYVLMSKTEEDLYEKCLAEKNMYVKDKEELENMTVLNFM